MAMYMNRDAPGSGLASLMAMQGRMGDTELVHMNPMEVKMFDAMTPGGLTRNPKTGAPEGFAWWLPIAGAAIGGLAGGARGGGFKNVLKGAALGGLLGLGGAGFMSATGLGATTAGSIGSPWGPFSGLQGLFGTGAGGLSSTSTLGGPNVLMGGQAATQSALPLSSVPHTMGMFGGVSPQAALQGATGAGGTSIVPATINPFIKPSPAAAFESTIPSPIAPTFSTPEALRLSNAEQVAKQSAQPNWLQKLFGTSSTTGREPVEGKAAEQTWLQKNRLPVSVGVGAATLLAGQQPPTFEGLEDVDDRRFIPSKPIRGRAPRRAVKFTADEGEELLTQAGGPGLFLEDIDIEESGIAPVGQATGGLISLQSGGALANQGRFEDNTLMGGQVAHISAREADLLKRMGGAATINPETGLPEYYFTGVAGGQSAAAAGPGAGIGYGGAAHTSGGGQSSSGGGGGDSGGTTTTTTPTTTDGETATVLANVALNALQGPTTTQTRAGPQTSWAAPSGEGGNLSLGNVTQGLGTQGMGFAVSPGTTFGPQGVGLGGVGFQAGGQSYTSPNYALGPLAEGTSNVFAPGLTYSQQGIAGPSSPYGAGETSKTLSGAGPGLGGSGTPSFSQSFQGIFGTPGADAGPLAQAWGIASKLGPLGMLSSFVADSMALGEGTSWSPGMQAQAQANAAAQTAATGRQGTEIKESGLEPVNQGGLIGLAQGGTIARQAGGGAWTGHNYPGSKPPPPGLTYVPGMGAMGGPKLMSIEDAGGLYTTEGGVMAAPGFIPASQLPSSGGGGGAPAPEPSEIRGRTPRTYIGPTTEQEIFEYATGVRPGGFPSFLSGAFTSGGPQTEQAVVDQFIGAGTSPTTGSTTSEQEIVDQFIGSAHGGSVFEGQVHTTGDGMSDDRRFDIVESQHPGGGMGFYKDTGTDAVIARDEYVWPADAVAMLGNGSSNAGADILDNAVKNIRYASTGQTKQVNEIDGKKELNKALTA